MVCCEHAGCSSARLVAISRQTATLQLHQPVAPGMQIELFHSDLCVPATVIQCKRSRSSYRIWVRFEAPRDSGVPEPKKKPGSFRLRADTASVC